MMQYQPEFLNKVRVISAYEMNERLFGEYTRRTMKKALLIFSVISLLYAAVLVFFAVGQLTAGDIYGFAALLFCIVLLLFMPTLALKMSAKMTYSMLRRSYGETFVTTVELHENHLSQLTVKGEKSVSYDQIISADKTKNGLVLVIRSGQVKRIGFFIKNDSFIKGSMEEAISLIHEKCGITAK